MRSSFGFTAIAISTIQIATIQAIAVAKPISNLNQIATEVSVRVAARDSYGRESVGAIVKKDRDLYSVLLNVGLDKETKQIVTYDDRKHPILAINNYSGSTIVKFRSPRNYRVVAIGDSNAIGKNDEIYISSHKLGKIFIQPSQVLTNNSRVFLYDDRKDTPQRNNELIFNAQGELIGFHSGDKWSIDDEDLWPNYGSYTYPTIQTLEYLYHSAMTGPECGTPGLMSARRRATAYTAIRSRYYTGDTIASLNLPATKLGVRVKNKQKHQFQASRNDEDFATLLKILMSDDERDKMILALDRAIQINPLNPDLYAIRGNARVKSALDGNRDIASEQKMLADFDRAKRSNY
jgi:hypothetical protein